MRVVGWLSFIMLAGFALGLVAVGPAAAQGSGADPTGGSSAIQTRSERMTAPPRLVVPAAFREFRMSLRFAFARLGSPSWSRTWSPAWALDVADPAYVPTRRRAAR